MVVVSGLIQSGVWISLSGTAVGRAFGGCSGVSFSCAGNLVFHLSGDDCVRDLVVRVVTLVVF